MASRVSRYCPCCGLPASEHRDPTAGAVAIVRALAKECPTDYDGYACGFCKINIVEDDPPPEHSSDCLYRLAVEWDKENPK